jgi:hypothetical protein
MYFNGSLKLGGAGVDVLFISLDGKQLKYVFKSSGKLQIMKQNTKPLSMDSKQLFLSESSDYSSTVIQ